MAYLKKSRGGGSNSNKSTAFGTPFGTTTTTSSGFGGFGSTSFGTPVASTAPTFGNTFGTQTASATPVFGSNFGNPGLSSAPHFGAPGANSAPAFGAPGPSSAPAFGAPGASTAPAFGAPAPNIANAFGAPAPNMAPAFGAPGPSTAPPFGAPGPSTAPQFGSTFGTPSSVTPAFGSSFGTVATSSAPSFGSTFGTPASSAPSLFGTPSTKPSLFGTPNTGNLFSTSGTTGGLFGGSTTTQAPSLFGTTPAPSLFGNAPAPSLFGGSTTFGTTTTAPTGGLFGSNFGVNTGTGLFGATPTSTTQATSSLFGGGMDKQMAPGVGFGGFGTSSTFGNAAQPTTTTPNLFGFNLGAPKPATPALPTADLKHQQLMASIYAINIFGDERDHVLKKWNMLQACWGTGKGYYSNNQPPVEYDHTNPFYRFKTIAYSVIPQPDNNDGLVKMHFNKKEDELQSQKEVLVNGIAGILGNKPNLTVNIEHIKALSDTETEVMISVIEKGVTGASRKIYASDLAMFLNQPVQKQQLTNVGVTYVGPYMSPTKAQLEEHMRTPPAGIDMQMWVAAQLDNPNPAKFMPTPLFGFGDLRKRMLCQEYETGLHMAFLEKTGNAILDMKRHQTIIVAKLQERKQNVLELHHRILRLLIRQETLRKMDVPLHVEEEVLKAKMENIRAHLNVSTQFRGKLNELASSVTLMDKLKIGPPVYHYRMDPSAKEDIKQVLEMEQKGIKEVVKTINKDLKDLKKIQDGLSDVVNGGANRQLYI